MDVAAFWKAEFTEHHETARRTEAALSDAFARLLAACVASLRSGGKIMFFGNGGSAADAQHLAAELVVRYKKDRPAIASMALTTDTSVLTAGGNDLGFEQIFARQIEAFGKPGDVAIGISTSGKSPNVLAALERAKALGLVTAAFGGKDGGDLRSVAEHALIVPCDTTARIQEMHITIGQMLCGAIELELGLVS